MMKINFKIVLTSLILTLPLSSYAKEDNEPDKEVAVDSNQIDMSQVIIVSASKTSSSLTLGGTIIPSKLVNLNAEFPGRVNYLAGDVGDKFEAGTILVQIDDVELRAKREEIIAQINIADASFRNSEVQHNRAQVSPDYNPMMGNMSTMFNKFPMDMFSGGNKSVERYSNVYQYQAQMEQARAALRQAEAQLQQLDSKIRNTQTVAPFSGVIVRKFVEMGDTIQPGQPILQFANLKKLQMQIDVPDRMISGLKTGMLLPAKIESTDMAMEVQIDQIYPIADLQKHTVKVKLNLPLNMPASPGMYAEVSVPNKASKKKPSPMIPSSALIWRGTLPAVNLVNDQNKTELRLVRIGGSDGRGNVKVLSGIKIGDKILIKPETKGWQKGGQESQFK